MKRSYTLTRTWLAEGVCLWDVTVEGTDKVVLSVLSDESTPRVTRKLIDILVKENG